MDTQFYHQGSRQLQDAFHSRPIADRLEEVTLHTAFTSSDQAFIESAIYFFLATADASGHPDVSFKGGPGGFVRVTGPAELAFPDYDGNGMFRSLGNLVVNPLWACCSSLCMAGRAAYASAGWRVSIEMIRCWRTRSAHR